MKLIEKTPNMGFFVFDEHHRYHIMRGPLHQTPGYLPEVAEGVTMYQLLPPETHKELQGYYDRALSGETFETKYASPVNGEIYHVFFFPIVHKGVRYGAGAVRDISGVISAERLLMSGEHKEYLAKIVGKYHLNVSELLISIFEDQSVSDSARKKIHEVFHLSNGLQKIAGNIQYDFEVYRLDEIITDAHKKTNSKLNLFLNGGLVKVERYSLVSAIAEILKSAGSDGYIQTDRNKVLVKFSGHEMPNSFGYDVACAVLKGHGASVETKAEKKIITWEVGPFKNA